MGFLERAIQRGVSNAVGNAVEKGVRQAVEPKIEKAAANMVNSAAGQINQAAATQQAARPQTVQPQSTVNQAEVQQAASTLGGLFGGITAYANEAAKNMKICPACGEGAGADVKFCPKCGGKMPEQTLAQGAVCPSCGKQNSIGTKFCQDCGAKLPSAVAEEKAEQERNAEIMRQWDVTLAAYPKWSCGGNEFTIEQESNDCIMFSAKFTSANAAKNAVAQYRELLQQSGFRQAGKYQSIEHLYKKENGVCYHVDTEHCFDGDSQSPELWFGIREPDGGFDYVKQESKKQASWKDLFGI